MVKFFVLFLLVVAPFAQAQTYSLNALLRIADTSNFTLKNMKYDQAITAHQRSIYLSGRLPRVNFTGDYRYNALIPAQIIPADFFGGPSGTFAQVKFGVPFNLSNSIQLTQFLYNSQLSYGLSALAIAARVTEIQETIAQQEIRHQIATTFFSIQALEKQKKYLVKNQENLNNLIKNMEVMQQQGLVLPVDIEKIKINKISLSSNMLSIENTEKKLQQYLGILVGMPEKSTFDLEEDQILASQTIVDLSTTKRPELALLEAQKELNAEELRGTKMAYLPNLSFYASYNYNYNIMPEKDFRTGIPSSFIGLHLDWNLFDGLEKRNKIKINGYNREKLENQEIQLKSQLQLATENAKRDIDLQMDNLRLNEEQLVLANHIYQTTLAQFNAGTVSTSELLDTDNRKQLAESNVIGAYLQLRLAEIAYLKSLSQIK